MKRAYATPAYQLRAALSGLNDLVPGLPAFVIVVGLLAWGMTFALNHENPEPSPCVATDTCEEMEIEE